MGAGIAQTAANAGLAVIMIDVAEDAVARGGATIAASLDRFVKKGTLSAADAAAIASGGSLARRISPRCATRIW